MATTHQARYFLTERCIRMPHTELSRAVVGGEAPYISGPARQQIAVLLGNAGLAGETRDGLVKTLEEGSPRRKTYFRSRRI